MVTLSCVGGRCRVVAWALAAVIALGSCANAVTPSQPAFCRRVNANLDALRNVGDTNQASRTLTAYRNVAAVAPIGVRDAWTTLTAVIESAATDDLSAPTAQARFTERILTSKPAFDSIIAYTKDNCGLDLTAPPPTTAVPTTPAPPTTVAPATAAPTVAETAPDTTPATPAPETTPSETAASTTVEATTVVDAPTTTDAPARTVGETPTTSVPA